MFSGERIVTEKEQLKRDCRFLLKNGAWPGPFTSLEFPLIHNQYTDVDIAQISRTIYQSVLTYLDMSRPHDIRFLYQNEWAQSNPQNTTEALNKFCEAALITIKGMDASRYMFGFNGNFHNIFVPVGHDSREILVDLVYGIATNLGDGQRFFDPSTGVCTFSQIKGTRTHSSHLYVKGLRK